MRIALLRLTVVAAQISAAVALLGPGQSAAAAPALSSGRPASPMPGSGPSASPVPGSGPSAVARARRLFLVTGTQLGAIQPGHQPGALLTLRANGTTYAVPAGAVPYLGRGLDPSLFDVGALRRWETAGRLPVRVSYRGRPPALPGVRITRASAGTAEGYLTGSSAKAFGTALQRQYLADRARASYGADGLLRGVSIALAGPDSPAARPASPARPAYRMHTLTVTGTNLAGKPDTGDVAFVWNVDNGLRSDFDEASAPFYHGVAKFSVPAGHYWAVGIFGRIGFPSTSATRLTVLPQFTVAANTTVHLAEQAANSKVTIVTPRPAVVQSGDFYLIRGLASGPPSSLQFINFHSPLWVSPTSRRPTVGWLQADASQELTSARGAAPYAYAVSYADPRGTIPRQRYLVRPASLATVSDSYYQDVKSPGYWAVYGTFPRTFNGYVEPFIYSGSLPGRRTMYLGGSPSAVWGSYYGALGAARGNFQEEFFRAVRPGEHLTDGWNAYPLHPAVNVNLAPAEELVTYLPSADRAGNRLTLEVTPFGDNQPGHTGYGFAKVPGATITGSYRIDENGKRIAAGNAARLGAGGPFYTRVKLLPEPSVIRFTLAAARTGKPYQLSTASRTVWTWRSAHETGATLPPNWYCFNPPPGPIKSLPRHCAVQPMMTLRYQVAGMALNGSAPAGRQALTITAGHLQLAKAASVTGASVQVSFGGGKTWHRASVTALGGGRFRAEFTAPAGAYITLRTIAHDAAAGSITETITRAYATASRT